MSKYDPIGEYLKGSGKKTESLSYEKIEGLVGAKLPQSAYAHRSWWANTNRAPATSWLNAGWQVNSVKLGKSVAFKRTTTMTGKKKARKSSSSPKKAAKKPPAQNKVPGRKAVSKAKHVPEPISEHIPKLIKDFYQLKVEGIITDAEFERKKAELLKRS